MLENNNIISVLFYAVLLKILILCWKILILCWKLSTEKLMPLNCGAGEDSSESLGQGGDLTIQC